MAIELKIKAKHLAEEAKIIRFEEKKQLRHSRYLLDEMKKDGFNGDLNYEAYKLQKTYRSLRDHRTFDVRNEARATQLARAYLNGVPYKKVEQARKEETEYNFFAFVVPRIARMSEKYGKKLVTEKMIKDWINQE